MALDKASLDSLADCFVQVVDRDGRVALSPRVPEVVGHYPWDWCVGPDREACREGFIQACMFRREGVTFQSRIEFEGRIIRAAFQLFPLETGQVLCLFTRVFEATITTRERHVLELLAYGASTAEVAKKLSLSASTARDHIASIKRKLHIVNAEGYRLAAHYYRLAAHSKENGKG